MLAYLLGLFVEWRILAVLGNVPKDYLWFPFHQRDEILILNIALLVLPIIMVIFFFLKSSGGMSIINQMMVNDLTFSDDNNLINFFSGILPCTILIPGLFFIPESPRWLVNFMKCAVLLMYLRYCYVYWCKFLAASSPNQAKMGMTEDFESSLQVLRGFDTDISVEVHEIKVFSVVEIILTATSCCASSCAASLDATCKLLAKVVF